MTEAETKQTADNSLLLIPPFPGARTSAFRPLPSEAAPDDLAPLVGAIRKQGIVGRYWEPSPGEVPPATALAGSARRYLQVENPFTGEPMSGLEAVALCAFWRDLIRSNRDLAGGLGMAFWKQDALAPLLWDGVRPLPFWRSLPDPRPSGAVAVWGAKTRPEDLATLAAAKVPVVEVEDGFLRSAGLGADCVPPLSITVDRLGPYFDPTQPSELEQLLESADLDAAMLNRARRLREVIVAAGLGKYERGGEPLPRWVGDRRHLLVTGQVEDDRSVMSGGMGLTNLTLLERVRAAHPNAFILYKPHPDGEAGHRKGAIAPQAAARLADRLVPDLPIASLIDLADEIHVITSLAGFEALLRAKDVTTYGVPFYAGWGLTRDLGPVPPRRTRRRSLDELVGLALLVYPRYLDPVTGLPCPAEIVVDRLCSDAAPSTGLLVSLRRAQGSLAKGWRKLVQ